MQPTLGVNSVPQSFKNLMPLSCKYGILHVCSTFFYSFYPEKNLIDLRNKDILRKIYTQKGKHYEMHPLSRTNEEGNCPFSH
jgi:hypothetical protein